jgi:cellulose synthase/poly-beta-1,6-N-acetylglucosamine synthase-like glycosyltransferase
MAIEEIRVCVQTEGERMSLNTILLFFCNIQKVKNKKMKEKPDPSKSRLYIFDGNPESKTWSIGNFKYLPANSIIERQTAETMKLMIWVTMYNEPYKQFVETMAGVFRGYYELWGDDVSYKGKVSVVVVLDGFNGFDEIKKDKEHSDIPTMVERLCKVGLYNKWFLKNYRWKELTYESQLNSQIKNENSCKEEHEKDNEEETKEDCKEETKTKDFEKDSECKAEDLKIESEEKERKAHKYNIKYANLNFMNKEADDTGYIDFETKNLAHCFSRNITFGDLMEGLTEKEKKDFTIDNYTIHNFMKLKSTQRTRINQKYESLPMDIHFVIKHKNKGKIESHLWFFKGFCNQIKPEFWLIIDAGTIALWNSISKLIFYMEKFVNVGGAWGEIEVMLPEKDDNEQPLSFFQSVILRSQYVEYKISHYLDKAAESFVGFVSVLPGAFSAFRWKAIEGEPLKQFLRGHTLTESNPDKPIPCSEANKYLAEDRIMCLEIVSKPRSKENNQGYILRYVPGVKAFTDGVTCLGKLIKQRRRWFNGSMFATYYVLRNMPKVWRSDNSFFRKIFFMFLYLYIVVTTLIGYFIVGLFYASFSIFVRAIFDSDDCLSVNHAANVLENLYLTFLFFCLILSVWVKVEDAEIYFRVWCVFMGAFTILMIVSMVYYYFESDVASKSVYFFIVIAASYLVPLICNFRSLRLTDSIRGIVYVIFMSPTYININSIYAISNIHDVSWGSRETVSDKNANLSKQKMKDDDYQSYRAKFLITWILLNNLVAFAVVLISRNEGMYYLLVIGGLLMIIVGIKIVLSILHHLMAFWDEKMVKKHINSKRNRSDDTETEDTEYQNMQVFYPYADKEISGLPNEDPGLEDRSWNRNENEISTFTPRFNFHNGENKAKRNFTEDNHEEKKLQKVSRAKYKKVAPCPDNPNQLKRDRTRATGIESDSSYSDSEESKVSPKNNIENTFMKRSSLIEEVKKETSNDLRSNRPSKIQYEEDHQERGEDKKSLSKQMMTNI